jgi:hypothetical protein
VDKSFFAINIIEAVSAVIRAKKEHEITMQDLHHANGFLQQAVKNQEDFVALMQEIATASQTFPQTERQKIYRCIARMYKNLIAFEEECNRILTSNKDSF